MEHDSRRRQADAAPDRRRKRPRAGAGQSSRDKRRKKAPRDADDPTAAVAQALSGSASSPSHTAWRRHALVQLFPSIQTLLSYLSSLQPEAELIRAGDTAAYLHLLRTTLVAAFAPFATASQPARRSQSPSTAALHERLRDILFHASTRSLPHFTSRPLATSASATAAAASASAPSSLSAFPPFPAVPLSPWLCSLPSVLSLGYRRVQQGSGSAIVDHPSIECFEINSAVSSLQHSALWLQLLDRAGDAAVHHLLLHCFCFESLPNACALQLSGPVLADVVRAVKAQRDRPLAPASTAASNADRQADTATATPAPRSLKRSSSVISGAAPVVSPLKRTRTDVLAAASFSRSELPEPAPSSSTTLPPLPAARPRTSAAVASRPPLPPCIHHQVIPRSSIFFHYAARTRTGLPEHHVLNQLQPTKRGARRLLSLVFKLTKMQQPLPLPDKPPFSAARSLSSQPAASASSCVVPPPCRLPSQLQSLLSPFRRLLRNHHHTAYAAVLASKFPNIPLTAAALSSLSLPELLSLSCPHAVVASYVRAVLVRLVPLSVFGSRGNRHALLQAVDGFVWLRRGESMLVREMMTGMKVTEVGWLQRRSGQGRVDRCLHRKQEQLLSLAMRWLLTDVVVPLLRCSLHVTDSETGKNSISYFPHAVWQIIAQRSMAALTTSQPLPSSSSSPSPSPQFRKLSPSDVRSIFHDPSRKLGVGHLRLRPRRSGLRPIVNMARGSQLMVGGERRLFPAVNVSLRAAFDVLSFEVRRQDGLLGCSVFGLSDVQAHYRQLVMRLREAGRLSGSGAAAAASFSPVYIVCMDIQQCFDCIDRGRLLQLLPRVLQESSYALHRYSSLHSVLGAVHPRYHRLVYPSSAFPSFSDSATSLSSRSRQRVFTDHVSRSFLSSSQLLQTLSLHVTSNVVRFRGELYEQERGIPQGSVLSSLLCCLFLGQCERKLVLPLLIEYEERKARKARRRSRAAGEGGDQQQPQPVAPVSLLLRQMDDILFIATDLKLAAAFVPALASRLRKVGLSINDAKTKTSFPLLSAPSSSSSSPSSSSSSSPSAPPCPPSSLWMPWSGLQLHSATLEVRCDYGRYLSSSLLSDHITVDFRQPGRAMSRAILRFVQSRAQPLLLDAAVNGEQRLACNWFGLYAVAAMKAACYARALQRRRGGFVNQHLLLAAVRRSVDYGWSLLRSRLNRLPAQQPNNAQSSSSSGQPLPSVLCAQCRRRCCRFHPLFPFNEEQMRWLACRAYCEVMQRKHSRYPELLRGLLEDVRTIDVHQDRWREGRAGGQTGRTAAAAAGCVCCSRWSLLRHRYQRLLDEHRVFITSCKY